MTRKEQRWIRWGWCNQGMHEWRIVSGNLSWVYVECGFCHKRAALHLGGTGTDRDEKWLEGNDGGKTPTPPKRDMRLRIESLERVLRAGNSE